MIQVPSYPQRTEIRWLARLSVQTGWWWCVQLVIDGVQKTPETFLTTEPRLAICGNDLYSWTSHVDF